MNTELNNLGDRGGLRMFAKIVVVATFFLILAGGNVTSKGAGLAVPDWPTSFHSLNPAGWTSNMDGRIPGVRDEHFHRLVGATIGLLVIVLAIGLWRTEPRAWVRRLGWIALLGVVLQGLLGGLRVILKTQWDMNSAIWFAVIHACVAQAFFCLTIALVMVLSPSWPTVDPVNSNASGDAANQASADQRLRLWTVVLTVSIYLQVVLGAVFRHTGASVMGIVHVLNALLVGALLIQVANYTMPRPESDRLSRPTIALFLLYGLQIVLGVISYLAVLTLDDRTSASFVQTYAPTLHVATGAAILGTSFALAFRSFWLTRRLRDAATEMSLVNREVLA